MAANPVEPGPPSGIHLMGRAGNPIDLYNEDALSGIPRRLSSGSVSVAITSPPYNLGVDYASYRDRLPREEYLRWSERMGSVVAGALEEKGSFFLNVGAPPKDPWIAWDVAREVGRTLVLQNVIHWVKSIAIDRASAGSSSGLTHDLALGHYKPVGSARFLHGAHEYIFHFTHHGDVGLDRLAIGVPYQDKSNVRRWGRAERDVRCRGTTWFLPYPTIRRRATDRPHPATFPVELPERCLRLHGLSRVKRAIDPFVGIGASALAANRLGVPFVGFDLDAGYLGVARRRLEAEGARPVRESVARTTPARSAGRRRGLAIK